MIYHFIREVNENIFGLEKFALRSDISGAEWHTVHNLGEKAARCVRRALACDQETDARLSFVINQPYDFGPGM